MEEDCEPLQRRALEVGEIPEDFDPHKTPTTGEEYLHYVMYEKLQCQEFVRADIKIEKFSKKKAEIEIIKGCESAPEPILPSLDWQNNQIAEFTAFRLYLEKIRDSTNIKCPHISTQNEKCLQLCSKEPKFSEIMQYSQNVVTAILEHQIDWLDNIKTGSSISRSSGIWLYALLARLEIPLMPSICSLIRELARKCSKIRCALPENPQENDYIPLNLFICLVARYFNQTDLADN